MRVARSKGRFLNYYNQSNGRPVELERQPDGQNLSYPDDAYFDIETITKIRHRTEAVREEGDIRTVYIDHTFTVDFIFTDDSDVGYLKNYDPIPGIITPHPLVSMSFQQKLELLHKFLYSRALDIHFGGFPDPMRRMANSSEDRFVQELQGRAAYQANVPKGKLDTPPNTDDSSESGWLIANHNGIHTTSVDYESLAGENSIMVTWSFSARTSADNRFEAEITAGNSQPTISSELRLDIDDDGDLIILFSGTVYADSLKDLYAARDWLRLKHQPTEINNLYENRNNDGTIAQTEYDDVWMQVNGFKKSATFNITKTGRSATFSIRYTQVKSNNAYPIGLRDITFEQTIESTLLETSVFQGMGFRTWKQEFAGTIKIPPRMNAVYAWYVFHLLMQQQLRHSNIKIEPKQYLDEEGNIITLQTPPVNRKIRTKDVYCRAIPMRMKIKHSHYEREVSFEVDYFLVSPLQFVLFTSSIFKRINNDYQRKIDEVDPTIPYKPLSLSRQWLAWNRSVNSAEEDHKGLVVDPYGNYALDKRDIYNSDDKNHRDVSGIEVIDTGHNQYGYERDGTTALSAAYLAEKTSPDLQKTVLVTTVIDPDDNDVSYKDGADQFTPTANSVKTTLPGTSPRLRPNQTLTLNDDGTPTEDYQDFQGTPPVPPIAPFSLSRDLAYIDPRDSWISYNQEYEIKEINYTNQVVSVGNVTAANYQNDKLYNDFRLDLPRFDPETGAPIEISEEVAQSGDKLRTDKGFHLAGRRGQDDFEPESNEPYVTEDEKAGVKRKTYATTRPKIIVTVKGYAFRSTYKIPMPAIITIAGHKAIRVGEGKFSHKDMAPDADTPVYRAMWVQSYTVDGEIESADILANIEDTGASFLYV